MVFFHINPFVNYLCKMLQISNKTPVPIVTDAETRYTFNKISISILLLILVT